MLQITVHCNRKVYNELMAEDEKLHIALRNAEEIRNDTQFFASISHELKTPLNVIQGFSMEIMKYDGVPLDVQFFAKQISEASTHILTIVSDLLEHFRLKLSEYWIIRSVPMDVHLFWSKTCHKVWIWIKCMHTIINNSILHHF